MEQRIGRSVKIVESGATRTVWECSELGDPKEYARNQMCFYVPLLLMIVMAGFLIFNAVMVTVHSPFTFPSFYLPIPIIMLGLSIAGFIPSVASRFKGKKEYHTRFTFDLSHSRATITSGTKGKSGYESPEPARYFPLENARVDIVKGLELRRKANYQYDPSPFKGMHVLVLYLPLSNTCELLHYSPSIEEVTKFRDIIQEFLGRRSPFSSP